MVLSASQVECLLTALLAVNQYPLDRVGSLLPRMRELGLTDPSSVADMALPTVIELLVRAGYDRKGLTWLFAERLQSLMRAVSNGTLSELPVALAARDQVTVRDLLLQVRGVGPKVVETAWNLLTK